MATHSTVLAWRVPGTGEPGGLPSVGSHRVRHRLDPKRLAAHSLGLPLGHGGHRSNVSKVFSLKYNIEYI